MRQKIGFELRFRATPKMEAEIRKQARDSGESVATVIRRLIRIGMDHSIGTEWRSNARGG